MSQLRQPGAPPAGASGGRTTPSAATAAVPAVLQPVDLNCLLEDDVVLPTRPAPTGPAAAGCSTANVGADDDDDSAFGLFDDLANDFTPEEVFPERATHVPPSMLEPQGAPSPRPSPTPILQAPGAPPPPGTPRPPLTIPPAASPRAPLNAQQAPGALPPPGTPRPPVTIPPAASPRPPANIQQTTPRPALNTPLHGQHPSPRPNPQQTPPLHPQQFAPGPPQQPAPRPQPPLQQATPRPQQPSQQTMPRPPTASPGLLAGSQVPPPPPFSSPVLERPPPLRTAPATPAQSALAAFQAHRAAQLATAGGPVGGAASGPANGNAAATANATGTTAGPARHDVPRAAALSGPAPLPAPAPMLAAAPVPLEAVAVTPTTRRLPGPLGVLPPLSSAERERLLRSSADKRTAVYDDPQRPSPFATNHKRLKRGEVSQLQPDQRIFGGAGPWQTMLRALHLPPYSSASSAAERTLLEEHNVASVLNRPFAKKVPHLILYLKDVLPGSGNVFAKFVDPTGGDGTYTGEIHGTVHKRAMEEFANIITPGCVLVLQKVSVFNPTPRTTYLNITRENVVTVFPAEHSPTAPAPDVEAAPAPAAATEHRAVLQAAAAAIPGAAAADVDTIATFLEGLDDSFFGDDL